MSIFQGQHPSILRTLPHVEGGRLFRPGFMVDPIMIGTPAWFEWLERHAAFTFADATCSFTAYKRPPRATDSPWEASHKLDGRRECLMLGPSSTLTPEHLHDAARTFATRPEAFPVASGPEQARAAVTGAVTYLPGQRAIMSRLEGFARRPGGDEFAVILNGVDLEERQRELQTATGVQALAAAAAARDGSTAVHAQRMVELAVATARQLGQAEGELYLLRLCAILHDIGKIGIPDAILYKPGPLTEEERLIMRTHPDIGERILQQIGGVFEQLAAVVVAHHERWDGKGYPRQLAGEAIPLHARILAVVDAYDAMTTRRLYRRLMTTGQARAELLRCSGTQFDSQVVEAFVCALKEHETLQVVPA